MQYSHRWLSNYESVLCHHWWLDLLDIFTSESTDFTDVTTGGMVNRQGAVQDVPIECYGY